MLSTGVAGHHLGVNRFPLAALFGRTGMWAGQEQGEWNVTAQARSVGVMPSGEK